MNEDMILFIREWNAYFNMSVYWAYMHIFQPQLCMGKTMTMQVIHLKVNKPL